MAPKVVFPWKLLIRGIIVSLRVMAEIKDMRLEVVVEVIVVVEIVVLFIYSKFIANNKKFSFFYLRQLDV